MSEYIVKNHINNIQFTAQKPEDKEKRKKANIQPTINLNNDMNDVYVSAKGKRGFIAKFYGFINKVIPLGLSDKKVKKKLIEYQEGKISKQDTKKYIDRYENANFNSSEITIDTISSIAAVGVGFLGKKAKTLMNIFTPKYKKYAFALTAGASILTALAVKIGLKSLDSLGKDKNARKEQKRTKENLISGTMDGVSGFISSLNPMLIPAGLAINAFTRYITDKKDDETLPSISDFIEKQKDSAGIGLLSLAGVSIAAAKGHLKIAEIKKAIQLSKLNQQHVISYKPPQGQLTEFQQLARDIGYDLGVIIKGEKFDPTGIPKLDEDFMKILLEKGQNGNIESKIKKLEDENIFLPKYLQTVVDIPDDKQAKLIKQIDQLLEGYNERKNNSSFNGREFKFSFETSGIDKALEELDKKGMDINGFKDLQQILKRIKSSCPTSRSIEDAQKMLDTEYKGKYKIEKLLGVGSVAESYLVRDSANNEYVAKLTKQHFLDKDKIATDKAKIIEKINLRAKDDYSLFASKQTIKTKERKEYDLNQIDNMYKVWGNEIHLNQEAISAKEIGVQTSTFQPVGVIDAKQNIFIMEKAQGYQLDSDKFTQKWKEANLSEDDFKNFIENYVQVYCEQLFSLPKKGMKVVQSDPHGGNILVDIDKIKNLKQGSKPITIIDYGNTTKTTQTQAIKNLFNHIDYLVGNTDAIAESMLEGAKLGNNNKKSIIKEMSQALKDNLYNTDTKIDIENPVKIFSTVNSFCLDFMQKKNIIPNASHINQMKAEETYIISNLGCLQNIAHSCGYDLSKAIDKKIIIKQLVNEMSKATQDAIKINPKLTAQEISKRYKFFINNTEEALSSLGINFGIL